ncbi:hypothetical protein ACIBO1_23290 [Micromonospora sp. NPDC049903]|uniref:hypothetical protein n=1 Tax=Micromonospora sp. NPDC049903 TaxID=3364276 RepID=UPI0037942C48
MVEGEGELTALPVVLRRVISDMMIWDADIQRPYLTNRSRLVKHGGLEAAVESLARRVPQSAPGGILIVIDADDDCPATLDLRYFNGRRPYGRIGESPWFSQTESSRHGFSRQRRPWLVEPGCRRVCPSPRTASDHATARAGSATAGPTAEATGLESTSLRWRMLSTCRWRVTTHPPSTSSAVTWHTW